MTPMASRTRRTLLALSLLFIVALNATTVAAQQQPKTADTVIVKGICVGNACPSAGLRGVTTAITSRVTAAMASSQSSTLDLGTASFTPSLTYVEALTNGTGNDQFQIVYADSGTIAASDSVLIDLVGATPDAFGSTITCATGKGLMLTAPATNTNDVLLGGATTAQTQFLADTTDVVPVGPGGAFLLMRPRTGWTFTAGTRDKFRLKNSAGGTTVKYLIQLLCR